MIRRVIVFVFGLSLFGVFEVGLLFVIAFSSVGSALERRARGPFYRALHAWLAATMSPYDLPGR